MTLMEKEWEKSFMLSVKEICKLLTSAAEKFFDEYVKYVGNQNFQIKLLKNLLT